MTDQQQEEQEIPRSYILIEFAAPGATLFNMSFKNVYPGQMIIAADHLLVKGREYMKQLEAQQEAQERLVKPNPAKILVPK